MKALLSSIMILASAASARPPIDPIGSFDVRVSIAPKAPKRGIKTGLVIFLGHLIPPPYEFEWRGSSLFLNSVQISPTPFQVDQQRQHQEAVAAISVDDKKRIEESSRATEMIQDMARSGASHSEIFEYAKKQKVFDNVEWSGNSLVVYSKFKGQSMPLHIMLPQAGAKKATQDSAEIARINERGRAQDIELRERVLKANRVLVIEELGGVSERIISTSFPSSVPRIMDGKGTNEEKQASLERLNWGSEWELAKEIVANYDPAEWKLALSPEYDGHTR